MPAPFARLVRRDLRADVETPLSAYWKLAHDAPASFLLESVTGGEHLARFSLIAASPRAILRAADGGWRLDDGPWTAGDPLEALRGLLPRLDPGEAEGLPRFLGGAVGYVAYDYARTIERLPSPPADDLGLGDACLMLAEEVAVFDHARGTILLLALSDGTAAGDAGAAERVARMAARIEGPLPALPPRGGAVGPVAQNRTREDFMEAVARAVRYIQAGDCIQVVPSVRFERAVTAHPLSVYRELRSLNPSPYMYLLRTGGADVVGASPELLVGLEGRSARVRPIAGTRPRGATRAQDAAYAADLLADEKERAEHVMLVDLGRNDLGRVCEYGSVQVEELMAVERYSHVMHIVSSVTGQLRGGLDAVDLVRAAFPAGTVSGAPKVRAMQIIDELEPTRRGVYAGAIGYFSTTGDFDSAIAIRTAVMQGGMAYVQAGAGIVADSDPAREYEECANKAAAVLRALELAHDRA